MGDVSEHFSRKEFKCTCGNPHCYSEAVDVELLNVLEGVRYHFGVPVTITSGNRCAGKNFTVGGAKHSRHLYGIAADIKVEGVDAHEVYEWLDNKYPDTYGIGKYDSWTHIDVRKEKARWSK